MQPGLQNDENKHKGCGHAPVSTGSEMNDITTCSKMSGFELSFWTNMSESINGAFSTGLLMDKTSFQIRNGQHKRTTHLSSTTYRTANEVLLVFEQSTIVLNGTLQAYFRVRWLHYP